MLFISDLSENCVTNNRVKFVQIALYCLSGTTELGKPLINGEKKIIHDVLTQIVGLRSIGCSIFDLFCLPFYLLGLNFVV